jgi:hypothetical protein
MIMFESENDLLLTIERHNSIIRECVSEVISFEEFLNKYHDFYFYYALDGHESDEEEQQLLEKHKNKIEPHFRLIEELQGLCDDEEAEKESYILANRFGSNEGLRRLKEISKQYSI